MSRGFLAGATWGCVVAAIGLGVVSLVTEPPQQGISGPAPATAPATAVAVQTPEVVAVAEPGPGSRTGAESGAKSGGGAADEGAMAEAVAQPVVVDEPLVLPDPVPDPVAEPAEAAVAAATANSGPEPLADAVPVVVPEDGVAIDATAAQPDPVTEPPLVTANAPGAPSPAPDRETAPGLPAPSVPAPAAKVAPQAPGIAEGDMAPIAPPGSLAPDIARDIQIAEAAPIGLAPPEIVPHADARPDRTAGAQMPGANAAEPPPATVAGLPPPPPPAPPGPPGEAAASGANSAEVLVIIADDPLPAADPGAEAMTGAAAAPPPQPGFDKPVAGVQTGRLPRIGGEPAPATPLAEPAAEAVNPAVLPPVEAFAATFENPAAKPVFAILLRDTGGAGLDRVALAGLPFPVSFVIDPAQPDAAVAAAIYRAAGKEVVMLASGLPGGATAADIAVTFEAYGQVLPEAVAVLDPESGGYQGNRALANEVLTVIADQGRGVLSWDKGLNAASQIARREGLYNATIYRNLDASDERASTIRRFLDRAAFKAAQDGRVVVLGRTRPETIAALLEWAVEGRAATVAVAPVTAAMTRQ